MVQTRKRNIPKLTAMSIVWDLPSLTIMANRLLASADVDRIEEYGTGTIKVWFKDGSMMNLGSETAMRQMVQLCCDKSVVTQSCPEHGETT